MKHTSGRRTGAAVMIGTVGFLFILTTGLCIGLPSGFIKDFFIDSQKEKEQQEAIETYRENRDVKTEAEKAAEGDASAQLHLALSYGLGEGMEQDTQKAYEWMRKAADQGLPEAQYLAGEMSLHGIGTEADMQLAAADIRQASENGCWAADQLYAEFAFVGVETYQDYEISYPIFLENVQNSPLNPYALGVMHYYGCGAEVDYNLAAAYLKQASDEGIKMATTYLAAVQPRVTDNSVTPPKTQNTEQVKQLGDGYRMDYPDMPELISSYMRELPVEEHYEAFVQELDAMYQTNADVAASLTIFGKDNWLFFKNQADGQAYHDYVGDNAFSGTELEMIKKHLLEQKNRVESAGADFILMIVPNKEIVYAEKMPGTIERVSTITRTDLLVEYLRKETDIDMIYCKDIFLEEKDQYPLYYKSDTHWTMVGSFLALSDLMKQQYGKEIAFDMDMFTIPTPDYAGDLSVILQREDRYTDAVYHLPEENVREEDGVEDKLLLIGDSFGAFLNMEAQHYFYGGVENVEIGEYDYQFAPALEANLQKTQPDIVVLECVERYIERLAQ